jgi:hypothetical protein
MTTVLLSGVARPWRALTLIRKLNEFALLNRIFGCVFSLKPNGTPLP